MKRVQYVSEVNVWEPLHKVVWVASTKDEAGEYECPTLVVDLETNEPVEPDGAWFCDGSQVWKETG